MEYLTFEQIKKLFSSLHDDAEIGFERVRPHNKNEIRKGYTCKLSELLSEIEKSIEEYHIYGGNLEIPIPGSNAILVGHHDGLYWLEKIK